MAIVLKKYFCTLIFLLAIWFNTHAQKSTEDKLTEYKKWYENGLIDSTEYSRLKNNALSLVAPPPTTEKRSRTSSSTFKLRGKSRIVAGSILLGAGTGFIIGGIAYSHSPMPDPTPSLPLSKIENMHATTTGLLVGTGAVSAVVGAIITGMGIRDIVLYNNSKTKVSASVNAREIMLAYSF